MVTRGVARQHVDLGEQRPRVHCYPVAFSWSTLFAARRLRADPKVLEREILTESVSGMAHPASLRSDMRSSADIPFDEYSIAPSIL
jgi:hypothetical protein